MLRFHPPKELYPETREGEPPPDPFAPLIVPELSYSETIQLLFPWYPIGDFPFINRQSGQIMKASRGGGTNGVG